MIDSTTSSEKENTPEHSKDFRTQSEVGARNSKSTVAKTKLTYCDIFYKPYKWKVIGYPKFGNRGGQLLKHSQINGYPTRFANWCTSQLKTTFLDKRPEQGADINIVNYIGIANDEPKRIARHINKPDKVLPLVQIGWDEDLCGLIATYLDMLSPTYTNSFRDGCWFCHNQGVEQLRHLRKNYPDLWGKLLKLDLDSPVSFHADGHTVHDFDERFRQEDLGKIPTDRTFRWEMLNNPQITLFE